MSRVDRLFSDPPAEVRLVDDLYEGRTTLVLGCGMRPVGGAVNHDLRKHSDWVDVAHDLDRLPWPFSDGRFARVIGMDVFEHLRLDVRGWLAECWRILKPDVGELVLRVSAWDNPVSYRDPTHRRVFTEESFDYFDPARPLGQDYGQVYFPDGPWFTVARVERTNADPRWPDRGDIGVVLRKRGAP